MSRKIDFINLIKTITETKYIYAREGTRWTQNFSNWTSTPLKLTTSSIFAGSDLGAKPIKVTFNNIVLNPADFVVGEQVKVESIEKLLSQLSYTLREASYTPTTSKGIFLNLDVVSMGETCDVNFSTRNGMVIKLKDASDFTTDKFLLALERYNYFHQEGVVSGTIEVWRNAQLEQIVARYISL